MRARVRVAPRPGRRHTVHFGRIVASTQHIRAEKQHENKPHSFDTNRLHGVHAMWSAASRPSMCVSQQLWTRTPKKAPEKKLHFMKFVLCRPVSLSLPLSRSRSVLCFFPLSHSVCSVPFAVVSTAQSSRYTHTHTLRSIRTCIVV